MTDDDMLITTEHLATVPAWGGRKGFCARGARQLCARYGIDWSEVIRNGGIPASRLVATGDALALQLVEHAQKTLEAQRGRQ